MSETTQPLRILVIPGDGIGREVTPAAVAVLRATGLPLEFREAEAGWACFERHGTALPDETLAAARQSDAVLFGAVASPSHAVPGYRSPIVALRRALDLYANIRPVVSMTTDDRRPTTDQGAATFVLRPSSTVDLVVVRENTEDLYMGRERLEDGGDTAIAERVITRRASARIVRMAFELARARAAQEPETKNQEPTQGSAGSRFSALGSQRKVTIVHKANVLRVTDGLFRETALQVAQEYPDVAMDELLVDNAALQLVQRPERFDVIVTTNMFGDILSDVASYWSGGLGLASSANIGAQHALFEPVHGAAPDIAGKGIANPLAAIGCAAMLLEHAEKQKSESRKQKEDLSTAADRRLSTGVPAERLYAGWQTWAARIRAAMQATLANGPRTPDLDGSATTEEVTEAVIDQMKRVEPKNQRT
jgi:homoisocitrate dehydrogenase